MIENNELGSNAPSLEATADPASLMGGAGKVEMLFKAGKTPDLDSRAVATRGSVRSPRVDSSGINPMDPADLFAIYDMGANVRPLLTLDEHVTIRNFFLPMMNAQTAVNQLLGTTPQARVDLCHGEARGLKASLDALERMHFHDEKGAWRWPPDAEKEVGQYYLLTLKNEARAFETVLRAELQVAATYWVPKRGSYSTRDLVDQFDCAFLPDLHATIGPTALAEYRSAGRCFAFGLWSAAGYHVCRAVESVLRLYFSAYTGRPDKGVRNWGGLIHQLNLIKAEPKPKTNTMFYLQQLKDNDRNPLMHVRIVLDEQDADILLNAAKVVIALMARELIALEAEKKATPLLHQIQGGKAS